MILSVPIADASMNYAPTIKIITHCEFRVPERRIFENEHISLCRSLIAVEQFITHPYPYILDYGAPIVSKFNK